MLVSDRAGVFAICVVAVWAAPALADAPMTADQFDAYSLGRTLDYAVDGAVYGSELHLPGRRVRDADTGGPCRDGYWYPRGDAICFVYDGLPDEHCWRYWRRDDGLLAQYDGGDTPSDVTVAEAPLSCAGPDVGV